MQQRIITSSTTNNSKVKRGNNIKYVKNIAVIQYNHNWVDDKGELRLGARFEEVYLKNLPKDEKGNRYTVGGKITGYKYKKVRITSKEEQLIDILQDDDERKKEIRHKIILDKVNADKLPKSLLIEPIIYKLK